MNQNKNEEELSFWQDLIINTLSKSSKDMNFLAYENNFLKEYPSEIRNKIAIREVENWLNQNKNLDQVLSILSLLEKNEFQKNNLAYIQYLYGLYYQKKNSIKKARIIWSEIIKSSDSRAKMLATFALIEDSLSEELISKEEAVEMLMEARTIWHGGKDEYKILKRVKELYIEMGDKVAALYTIKLILENNLQSQNPFYLVAELSKLITDIFLNYHDLKDIKVISLFFEFKDMIPVGALGDEIILSIVKRMINLDMVDQATAILEHQIKFRQSDNNRALIGADLAEIYLQDHNLEKALSTLLKIKNVKVDEKLQERQKYLLARVYLNLGHYDQVKKILENDFSDNANEILIESYFKEKKWSALQVILELKVFQIDLSKDISENNKNYIEKLLFCYYIQGKISAIQDLRKMLEANGIGNQYNDFKLLAEFLEADLLSVDANSIKKYLSLENLKLFLDNYKNYIKIPIQKIEN